MISQYPLQETIDKYARIVKLTLLQNGADVTVLSTEDKTALDTMITSVVTIVVLHQSFERIQNTLAEE